MKKTRIDMCNGPMFGKMISYTIPIIFTGILQLLFNAADLIVVGRFSLHGSNSVAAIGATGALCNLLVNFFIGCSMGSGVVVAQAIGGKNYKEVHNSIHTAIPIALVGGVILSVVGIFYSKPLLVLMGTPKDIINLSSVYMKIYFSGITFSLLYNFGASILRAIGDTKRPLVFLTISGILNVFLNIIFVTIFKLDVAGVALATVISQCLSAVLVIFTLIRRNDECRLYIKKLRFHLSSLKKILKIGVPAGIQSIIFSISNVLIQSSVNSLSNLSGLVAGNAAASNIEGFVYIIMNSFYQTTLNFTGQNVGAKKYTRVKRAYIIALFSVAVVGLVSGLTIFYFAKPLLGLYITDSKDAIKWGIVKLAYVCAPYFLCGVMEVSTGVLRGMGVSMTPMIISILGVCGIRIGWILTVFRIEEYNTPQCLFFSYPISWIFTFLVQMLAFIVLYLKKKRDL